MMAYILVQAVVANWIFFTGILPSTSSLFQQHNNFKSLKFKSTLSPSPTILTSVEQTYYKPTSLLVEENIGQHYYKPLSTLVPNSKSTTFESKSVSNDYNLLMSKNNVTNSIFSRTVSLPNHDIRMQTPSTFYNYPISPIVSSQKNNQNPHNLSTILFKISSTKHSHTFHFSQFEKYNKAQFSDYFEKNQGFASLKSIKPTTVISDQLLVESINYTSSKYLLSLLDSSSLVFNLSYMPEFEEYKTYNNLSPNEYNNWSSTKAKIEKKSSKHYKKLSPKNLKNIANHTSVQKINWNFSHESDISSKLVNNSNKEVPVLETKIIKSNSIVLTDIREKEKRYCRLCKTATEPLRNQEDFTINMTSENQYFSEPRTKYTLKDGNFFETEIPVKSNASLLIIPTVPPVRILEPRTKMPFIPHTTISLPKLVTTSVLLDVSTTHIKNSIPLMKIESSKPLTYPEPRTISSYELEIMENSSNDSDLVSLDSSFRSSSDFTISHQKTTYLNLY